MNLVECLSNTEKDLIAEYIATYGSEENDGDYRKEFAGIDTVLSYWSNAKQKLYKMLGEKFIVSKEISFSVTEELLREEMNRITAENAPGGKFWKAYWDWYYSHKAKSPNGEELDYYDQETLYSLLSNVVYDPKREGCQIRTPFGEERKVCKILTPQGKTIDIFPSSKPMKILGKIAAAFDLDGFEDFRIAHSQVMNVKSIKGTLNLSIHPLDYMTMSDNDCGWESCMSWRSFGGYRQGTVEMMNSDSVVVAYLSASRPMHLLHSNTEFDLWANKKWRCLFVVNDDLLCKVKSYPYQKEEFELECLEWINELSTENLQYTYNCEDRIPWDGEEKIPFFEDKYLDLLFETGHMYNDFGTVDHWFVPHESLLAKIADSPCSVYAYDFCYSGPSECMWCGGNVYFDTEGEVICDNCLEKHWCHECGSRITGEVYTDADGNFYDEYCYDNYTFTDVITGERYHREHRMRIYCVPDVKTVNRLRDEVHPHLVNSRLGNFEEILRWIDTPYIQICSDHLEDIHKILKEGKGKEAVHEYEYNYGFWGHDTCYYIDANDINPDVIIEYCLDDLAYELNNKHWDYEFNESLIGYYIRNTSNMIVLEKARALYDEVIEPVSRETDN